MLCSGAIVPNDSQVDTALHRCRQLSYLHSRSSPLPRYNSVDFPHTSSATLKRSESFKTTTIKGTRVQPTVFLSRVPPFTLCICATNVSHAQFEVPQIALQLHHLAQERNPHRRRQESARCCLPIFSCRWHFLFAKHRVFSSHEHVVDKRRTYTVHHSWSCSPTIASRSSSSPSH